MAFCTDEELEIRKNELEAILTPEETKNNYWNMLQKVVIVLLKFHKKDFNRLQFLDKLKAVAFIFISMSIIFFVSFIVKIFIVFSNGINAVRYLFHLFYEATNPVFKKLKLL